MNDNISRQAALAYPLSWDHYDKEHGNRHFICGVESYREYIESLPSTDRTGHWIECDHEKWASGVHGLRCSECHSGYHLNNESILFNWDYCPACGADMRGERDE